MKDAYLLDDRGNFITIAIDDFGTGTFADTQTVQVISRSQDYVIVSNGHSTEYIHLISSNPFESEYNYSSDLNNSSYCSNDSGKSHGFSKISGKKILIIILVILVIYGLITLYDYICYLFR